MQDIERPDIRAGRREDINWDMSSNSGTWIFLDMGFASDGNPSCGYLVDDRAPVNMTFGAVCDDIRDVLLNGDAPVINLVIEAPLSVAFSNQGNPMPRAIEDHHHLWYNGPGVPVMVAAMYLLRETILRNYWDARIRKEIILYEGYVTDTVLQDPGVMELLRQWDTQDRDRRVVQLLRHVVQNLNEFVDEDICEEDRLLLPENGRLRSALALAGMDWIGIPVVMRPFGRTP